MSRSAVRMVDVRVLFTDRKRKLYIDHRLQRDFTSHDLTVDGERVTIYLCKPLSDRKAFAVLCRGAVTPQVFVLNAAGIACSTRSKQQLVEWMLRRLRVAA